VHRKLRTDREVEVDSEARQAAERIRTLIVHEYEVEAAQNRALRNRLMVTDGVWFSVMILVPGIVLGLGSGRASFLWLVAFGLLGYCIRLMGLASHPARQYTPDPGLVASFRQDKWLLLFYLIGLVVEVWRTDRPLVDAAISLTGTLLGYAANYAGQLERAKVLDKSGMSD